jgi:hypothetical protein
MSRKPLVETCQEKGGQYIHKPKRNGAAGQSNAGAKRSRKHLSPNPGTDRRFKGKRKPAGASW